LNSDDFPALGFPIKAILGSLDKIYLFLI